MSIRINSGLAKGMSLEVPKSTKNTRPTLGQLRQRIFNANQNLEGCLMVDLFAGTGAVGLEAASLGCEKVLFCESDARVFGLLKKNIENLQARLGENSSTFLRGWKMDGVKFIKTILGEHLKEKSYERLIFFVDPPYELTNLYQNSLKSLAELEIKSEIWIESDRQKGLNLGAVEEMVENNSYEFIKSYHQGSSFVAIAQN